MQEILPETGTTVFDILPQEPGTLRFTCSMGMYRGQIRFE
jgi:plastocyanin domain-containing protein